MSIQDEYFQETFLELWWNISKKKQDTDYYIFRSLKCLIWIGGNKSFLRISDDLAMEFLFCTIF